MELYEKIQVLRKAKGLTQAQLAESVDVTRQSVQKWENGVSSPDISKLLEIAAILGVSTDVLLDATIKQDELMLEVLNRQNKGGQVAQTEVKAEPSADKKSEKKQRSMLDWLILVPVLLGVGIGIFMFYVFGAMLIGFGFLFSGGSIIASIWSAVAIFINASNGIGAILICFGGVILGLGACYPLFIVSKWWLRKYKDLAGKLTVKLKKFDIRSI